MRILIDAIGDSQWIGGLYYRKNILFQLLQNDRIRNNTEIIVLTLKENKCIFKEFNKKVKIICIHKNPKRLWKYYIKLITQIYQCKFVFPVSGNEPLLENETSIYWIPDFQHNHFINFFSKEEIDYRNYLFSKIANSKNPLVLSSYNALHDLKKYYCNSRKNVYVVPFVSYIEDYIRNISSEYEHQVLLKYLLNDKKYVCCMNQFWVHKNHITLFRAIEELVAREAVSEIMFVFSGHPNDPRNSNYIDELNKYIRRLHKNVIMLGFIDRMEQIVIIKNAEYIIQPSLFEGWGTIVEDAKVLDKTILLSDISIHREQMNEKCILFNPYDSHELSKLIEEENTKIHIDNFQKGIQNMYVRAQKYSMELERLLFEDRE